MKDTKLICEFMGYKIWKPWIAKFKWFEHEMVTTPHGNFELGELGYAFENNWHWLKMVTDKIGKIPFTDKDGMREYMAINWSDSKINIYTPINEMYSAVIKFIEWYND